MPAVTVLKRPLIWETWAVGVMGGGCGRVSAVGHQWAPSDAEVGVPELLGRRVSVASAKGSLSW